MASIQSDVDAPSIDHRATLSPRVWASAAGYQFRASSHHNLAASRMELPDVFAATHRFVFSVRAARHGPRIDHVDGLCDPRAYCNSCNATTAPHWAAYRKPPLYLLVEKILESTNNSPDCHSRYNRTIRHH